MQQKKEKKRKKERKKETKEVRGGFGPKSNL
jgi:hypothetical protein